MNQLRRKFANLWNPAQQEDEGPAQPHGPNGNNLSRRSSSSSSSSMGVPAALELDAAGRSSPRRDGQDEKKADNDGADEHTSPPRLLSLSNPWGTSDPNPPPGWASSSSHPASQRRSHGRLLHVRHHSGSDRCENGTGVGDDRPSTHTDLGSPAAALGAAAVLGAAADGGGRRRRTREEEEEGAYRTGTYLGNTKRHRAEENEEQQELLAANEGEEGLDRRRQASSPFLRRTCPADSTFVSPAAAKRSVSYCASATGVPTNAVAADEEELELEHRRSSTPSRLIFRAGFFKALLGTKAVAKRARSATKLKRKTRELQAEIIRQAFHSAHPPHEGGSDDGGEEERKEEGVPRRIKGATGELSAREEEGVEMWRRVNVAEEEHGKAAEEKAMARMRRLKNLRAEALMAFGQAQEALADLVATANTAFDAAEGPDMAKLRSLFAGGADSPSSRFKARWNQPLLDDEEVRSLQKKYSALEAFLKQVKEANDAGNSAGLEALLSSDTTESVKNQPEVVSASETLKAARNKDTEDARAKAVEAAAAAAEAAKAQQEKDQAAAALAASQAQADAADQAKAAAESKAVAAALKKAQNEEQEIAQAAQAAAAGALVAEKARFAEKASELKAIVQGRRAAVDEILASTDPGVKKIRMAFKKSYQGCLNKLSATPSTVRQVARDIQVKAEAPLADARRAGWEANAKEFLFFNLADKTAQVLSHILVAHRGLIKGPIVSFRFRWFKLVDYSERDHFSGDSYRMAFPLACVAVDLMEEHEGLSELFLGTLYLRCPSAVPALSFDTAGFSDDEVMSLLGQTGGEDLPTFLNRTKGLVVLMAAVMQGWCWLARFVNGMAGYVKKGNPPPVPAGPVLEWFLKVAGFELQRHYGRAFDKVVQAIKTEILPILLPKSVVPHLLDVVMEDYEGRGRRFLPPAGRDKEFRNFRVWGDT
ncbi:unnamed protein product [Ectocarpus sp. CCAP 1310/34]|nr:unnamed protein product [Ectocarpus sp. CCAP 1310/34]